MEANAVMLLANAPMRRVTAVMTAVWTLAKVNSFTLETGVTLMQ